VDFSAAFEMVDHCCKAGIRGVLLFGEEGEYPAFTVVERSRLVYLAVKRSPVPVLVGVGSPTLDLSVELAQEALGAGAAAVLLPPPCFYHYQPDEIAEFCTQFARHMERDAAIFLYNTPCTASETPVETAVRLLETGLFAGIDDAGGDPQSFACLRAAAGRGSFQLLVGHDRLFPAARAAGCGAVSAAACAVPELLVALDRVTGAGNRAEVDRLSGLLGEFLDWTARFPQPVMVKTAAALRGLKTGPLPVPLSPGKQRLLEEFREWFRDWLPAMKKLAANV